MSTITAADVHRANLSLHRSGAVWSRGPGLNDVGPGNYLKSGHAGESVVALQRMLQSAGIPIEPKGQFGRDTRRAVRAFQRAHGCKVDGIVGPETMTALRRAQGSELNPAARKVIGQTPSRTNAPPPSGPTIPASRLIQQDEARRRRRGPESTPTPAAPPTNRPVGTSTSTTGPAPKPTVTTTKLAKPQTANERTADATHRRNMLDGYQKLKDSKGKGWAGNCNLFANRAMWTAGKDVKTAAESTRKTAMNAALDKANKDALANAPGGRLTRSQQRRLARTRSRIRGRFAAKNMHNYLPPLKQGNDKAFRGNSIRELASHINQGGEPRMRPGMTIHVKAFPHEKDPYGKSTRDPNNPKDQNHHWFTYIGKNDKGEPMFTDSRGKQRTADDCDRWLRGWMKGTLRRGQTRFGDYSMMKDRLTREGKYVRGKLQPGVQPTIEGVYSPY